MFLKGDGGILPEGGNPAHSTLDLSTLLQTLIKDFKDWSPGFPNNALTDFPLGGSWCQSAHWKWPGPSKWIKHVSLSSLRMLSTYLLSLPASMECTTVHLRKLAAVAVLQLQTLWGELHYELNSSWRLNWTNAILLHLPCSHCGLSLSVFDTYTCMDSEKKKSPVISLQH